MNKDKLKKIKLINNIFFYIAVAFSGYLILITYIDRSRLPEGVCPINNNQTLFYIAIAILIISFIASTIIDYKWKKIIKGESVTKEREAIESNTEEYSDTEEDNDTE